MKKRITFLCVYVISCFIGYYAGILFDEMYKKGTHADEVHVFMESYATNPAFLQMIEFVKLPAQTRKLIAWHRFPQRKKLIDLAQFNATEIDLPAKEAHYSVAPRKMFEAVQREMRKNPNSTFVFHVNLSHSFDMMRLFYKNLPPEKIRHIHVYEDGLGLMLKDPYFPRDTPSVPKKKWVQDLKEAIVGTQKWEPNYHIKIHFLFPTTYHLWGKKYFKTYPLFQNARQNLKQMNIQEVDFDMFKKELTASQKKTLYKLLGFDYDFYYQKMHHKKTFFFTSGYFFSDMKAYENQIRFLKNLQNSTDPTLADIKNYVWFYKAHPSYNALSNRDIIEQTFPNMINIPPQIPFEIFIIADLKPTQTAGYGSSLFYALESKDVLFYFRRGTRDRYLPFLLNVGKLKLPQVHDLNEFAASKDNQPEHP